MAITPEQEAQARALLAKGDKLGQQAAQQTGVAYAPAYTSAPNVTPQGQPTYAAPTPTPAAQTPLPAKTATPAAAPSFNLAPRQQDQQVQFNIPTPTGSSLLDFANALDAATNLAKQNRNALSLGIMMPYQGTVAASSFNSILGNMNAASDNTAANLTKRAIDAATPRYETQQIGNQLFQMKYDSSGQFLGATPIANLPNQSTFEQQQIGDALYEFEYSPNGQMIGQRQVGTVPGGGGGGNYETRQIPGVGLIAYDPSDPSAYQVIVPEPASEQKADLRSVSGVGLVKVNADGSYDVVVPEKKTSSGGSGGATATERRQAEISQVKSQIYATKGSDGYVNTEAYLNAYYAWDGKQSEFFDYFPVSMLNPDDPTVPDWVWENA